MFSVNLLILSFFITSAITFDDKNAKPKMSETQKNEKNSLNVCYNSPILSLSPAPKCHTKTPAALLVVDVQRCFIEKGSMGVKGGASIVPTINKILQHHNFTSVVYSLDYHPPDHISFASQHKKTLSPVELIYDRSGGLVRKWQKNSEWKSFAKI